MAGGGGRVYLSKDGRLKPEMLHAMYPRLDEWNEVRHLVDPRGVLASDLGRRLRIHAAPRTRVGSGRLGRRPMNDVTGMPQTVVSLGGGSELSRAILRAFAARRMSSVLLAGRSVESMEQAVKDLHGLEVPRVEVAVLDLTDIGALEKFADLAAERLGSIDLVLVAAGVLGTGVLADLDATAVASLATANFTGPAAAITAFSRVLRAQGHGRIVVLSSAAGYRVRACQFRLRGGQGRPRRLRERPRGRARGKWRQGDGREARLREDEDDREQERTTPCR